MNSEKPPDTATVVKMALLPLLGLALLLGLLALLACAILSRLTGWEFHDIANFVFRMTRAR